MSAYERVKPQVDELQTRFYALLDACDRYRQLLDDLTVEERAGPARDELVRRYTHQRGEVAELVDVLEGPALDALLRIIDRILMIKRTEDGDFV